ncbi:MAG TPA: hypothetical protein VHM91_12510, partial [Verrucomicrobiales bacterium]|nr:hypothetical protein [Verrucomicrobiales bacterium]
QTFLHDLEARPSDDPTTTAMRRQLGNPMDAVFISELLAAGETPDPLRLLAQRMNHLMEEYVASHKDPFPSLPFAEHLLTTRLTGAPLISMTGFEGIAEFLAKHRLLRKNSVADGWRFRHDKIMDWFLAPAFVNETDPVRRGLREDARFAGVPVQT